MKVTGVVLILLIMVSCTSTKKTTSIPVKKVTETNSKVQAGAKVSKAILKGIDQLYSRLKREVHGAIFKNTGEEIDISFDESGKENNYQLFAPGSSNLTLRGKESLDNLALIFLEYPDTYIRIEAYTDNIGSAGANMALTQRRAYSTANYLRNLKISPHHLMIRWYGETHPKVKNNSTTARAENRRLEMVLTTFERWHR